MIEISPLARYTFEATALLDQGDIEYTRVANGWFLDYYGMPHWKSHLHPWVNVLNMEQRWAAIPGDGSTKAHFVTTQDMGKFVAHLMDLKPWAKVSSIVGECLTFKQLIEMAEEARGEYFLHLQSRDWITLESGSMLISHRWQIRRRVRQP